MKKVTNNNIRDDIRVQVERLKALLSEVEPAERLMVLNEVMTALLPSRKSVSSVSDKLNRKMNQGEAALTKAQMHLIRGMSEATDRLRDVTGDDRA